MSEDVDSVSASLSSLSLSLLSEFCVLCNVWVAGSAATHALGSRHARWVSAARTIFGHSASAALFLCAALLRRETAAVCDAVCRSCRAFVGDGFRRAAQHCQRRHHQHTSRRETETEKEDKREKEEREETDQGEVLVRGLVCPLCVCVVRGPPRRHLLSARHKRTAQRVGNAAIALRARWETLLAPFVGNICCRCAVYVADEAIIPHVTAASHPPHMDAEAERRLAVLSLVSAQCKKRYCFVCDVSPKSAMAEHCRGRRHGEALLRLLSDSSWRERLPPESPPRVVGGGESSPSWKREVAEAPTLLHFVNGRCVWCGADGLGGAAARIAAPTANAHCASPSHRRAIAEGWRRDGAVGVAARWFASALHALRADRGTWHEPEAWHELNSVEAFLELLQSEERSAVFVADMERSLTESEGTV